MRFLLQVAISAIAVWVVTLLPLDVAVHGGEGDQWWHRALVFLFVGLVITALNELLKPILDVLGLPFKILTLGLFGLVISWFILWLAAWITEFVDFATLEIGGFWMTLFAALVISLATAVLSAIIPGADKRR